MYAVIAFGGKQCRVQVGEVVRFERIDGDPGDSVVFDQVLAVGEGDSVRVGTPTVSGALVRGTLNEQGRGDKIHILTYKRRKNSSRRRGGHRQDFTAVKIDAIEG